MLGTLQAKNEPNKTANLSLINFFFHLQTGFLPSPRDEEVVLSLPICFILSGSIFQTHLNTTLHYRTYA